MQKTKVRTFSATDRDVADARSRGALSWVEQERDDHEHGSQRVLESFPRGDGPH